MLKYDPGSSAAQRAGSHNILTLFQLKHLSTDHSGHGSPAGNRYGNNNGMKRVSQVYRGEDIYGEITLKNIHRSRIAQIAEKL